MRTLIALAVVMLARKGIPMRRMVSSLLAVVGLAIVAVAAGQSQAANLTTLYSFCALANCADGSHPAAALLADAKGNLFGTTETGGANEEFGIGGGTVFEIAKTDDGYATTPTTLVSFCSLLNCTAGGGSGVRPDRRRRG